MSAREYKDEIRAVMEAKKGSGRFVRFIDEKYEVDGDKVRIRATREDAGLEERTPIELLLGRGADGGWRILEEKSVGWR